MKKTKIIYWTVTILFCAFMLFSAIPDILVTAEAKAFLTGIGYPLYFIPFIGILKTLGVVALLIPGYYRIKEWAYAGFVFDLVGATYSVWASAGPDPGMLFMVLPIGFLFLSYGFYHKLYNTRKAEAELNPQLAA
jgi:hypothetical protein